MWNFKYIIFFLVLLSENTLAADYPVTCSGAITSALQTAINSATSGDTVTIGAGTCTAGGVSWTNKNITLQGAGSGSTIITDLRLTIISDNNASSAWRVTGISFTAVAGNLITIWDDISIAHGGWRIDHCIFNQTGGGYGIFIGGVTYGLIDNNVINKENGLAIIACGAQNGENGSSLDHLQGAYNLSLPSSIGTANNLFIEDNTFTATGEGGMAVFDSSSGNARTVFRHNTVTGGIFYTHWTRAGEIDGLHYEIYSNTFTGNAYFGDGDGGYPVRVEAGTGLIYNNKMTNYDNTWILVDERRGAGIESSGYLLGCDGSHNWDGNIEANGWPCLGQIGRAPGKSITAIRGGDKQASYPLYAWANGEQDGCVVGGTCTNTYNIYVDTGSENHIKATAHSNGDIDYCTGGNTQPGSCGTHTLAYTPYTYPHPLRGESAPSAHNSGKRTGGISAGGTMR